MVDRIQCVVFEVIIELVLGAAAESNKGNKDYREKHKSW
jgi:hypothetical protein